MTRYTENDFAVLAARQARRTAAPLIEPAALEVAEAEVLPAVLELLRWHPLVAWVERMNRGGFYRGSQYINFGFDGMPDLTGQMKTGARLECEVKRPGKRPTAEQAAHLARVREHGGVAFWADSVDMVLAELRKVAA